MKQEVRIQLDVSIELDAKYDAKTVREIVERGARKAFPNNHRWLNRLRFAEEAAIYSHEEGHAGVEWTSIMDYKREALHATALFKAEQFIAGFEDDDTQEGIPALLKLIRSQI